MGQQLGQPRRVVHVGLATGHVFDMRGVRQYQLEATPRQNLPDRLPVHPGRFHRHMRAAARFQPLGQLDQTHRRRLERAHRARHLAARHDPHARHHRLLVHVQTGTARMQHLHAFLPQPAAGVGYPIRELYKSCSRPRGSLAHSRVLEVPPVQLIPGFLTPRRRPTSGPATPKPITGFIPQGRRTAGT